MQLGFNKDHTIEQFLHHLVLTLVIGVSDRLQLDVCLSIDSGLCVGCRPRMLSRIKELGGENHVLSIPDIPKIQKP